MLLLLQLRLCCRRLQHSRSPQSACPMQLLHLHGHPAAVQGLIEALSTHTHAHTLVMQ